MSTNKIRIKKGDIVKVLTGKDKGKVGEVLKVIPSDRKVIVQGVNISKRHQKPTQFNPQGGILDKEMPLDISNVAYLDGASEDSETVTKIGFKIDENGNKVRYAKRSGEVIG